MGGPMAGKAADTALANVLSQLPEDKSKPIVTHCEIGGEANAAAKALARAGYTNVINAGSKSRVEKLMQ